MDKQLALATRVLVTQGLCPWSSINLIAHSVSLRAHMCMCLLLCRKSLCAISALFQRQPGVMKAFARGVSPSWCRWKCLYVGPLCAFYVLDFTVALEFSLSSLPALFLLASLFISIKRDINTRKIFLIFFKVTLFDSHNCELQFN